MPEEVFEAVQLALRRNSGRSETLYSRPAREIPVEGTDPLHLLRDAHVGTDTKER